MDRAHAEGLRVAVIGCGKMGREHARACRALGARVSCLCDPDRERAAELARGFPDTLVVAAAAELPWSCLDAVLVCTPPFARGDAELLAIEARVPFFVEKPVGLSARHAAAVLHALRARPLVHAVGYMNRYRPSVLRARRQLAGACVVGASCAWVGKPYDRPWWRRPEQSGGPLNEQCTHLVDLCRFLAGEVAEVAAFTRPMPGQTGVDDTLAVALRLRGGACATLLYSCLAAEKRIAFEVFTTGGGVRLVGWDLALAGEDPAREEDVFALEAAAFLGAVTAGDPRGIQSDFADALRTQLVVDAIARAARTGEPQRIPDLEELG